MNRSGCGWRSSRWRRECCSPGRQCSSISFRDLAHRPPALLLGAFANVNSTVFFRATTPAQGSELWTSDGTAAGTTLLKDIQVGAGSSAPGRLINVNGTLFFTANDGVNGYELWKSNGTPGGTVMVKNIGTGPVSSGPTEFTNVNGTLFFRADEGSNGAELWKSDGTAAGTVLVKDVPRRYRWLECEPIR